MPPEVEYPQHLRQNSRNRLAFTATAGIELLTAPYPCDRLEKLVQHRALSIHSDLRVFEREDPYPAGYPRHAQFTNLRSRTLLTKPSIRNIDKILEPPALISGSGMPVTGIRPTTIPTLTST